MSDRIIAPSGVAGRPPHVRLYAPADVLLGRQEHLAIVGAGRWSRCRRVLLAVAMLAWVWGSAVLCRAQTCDAAACLAAWARSEGLAVASVDSVALYTCGRDKFDALLSDIRAARRTVDVEYFIYANDSIGHALTALLLQKAAEGLRVRLVVDDYKAAMRHYGFTPGRCDSLRRAGVDVRMFDPWRFPYVNHMQRDHRKIVVVDGTVGYIGGLNVADYYIDGAPSVYGAWRDTHVRLTGPCVDGLTAYFETAFALAGGDLGARGGDGADAPAFDALTGGSDASAGCAAGAPAGGRRDSVILFERSRASRQKKAETRHAYIAAFDAVRRRMLIVNPYFMPTRSVRRALVRALDRGVEVEVLLSAVSDEPTLNLGCINFARRLQRHGAQIYLYRGAFHHSKILMLDDSVSMVGSANLNSRSLRWDYEASCFLLSPDVTRRLTDVFETDKLSADTLTLERYRAFPWGQRLRGALVNHLLTPFL